MYWRVGQFPELNHLTAEERERILRHLPRSTYFLMVARAFVVTVVVALLTGARLAKVSPALCLTTIAAVSLGGTVVVYQLQIRHFRRVMRRSIAMAFRGERLPFCLGCGYDLRGSNSDACPECGAMTIVPGTLQ